MIYFRADGNGKIGMGHIMRCIAIGREIRTLGEEVTFLLADEEAKQKVCEEGFYVQVLGTDYTRMDEEWERLDALLPSGSKILVDSYYVTEQYLQKLGSKAQVIYVDDMNAFDYPVDCIVNGNIYGADMVYHVPLVLGGCKYAPLRREYHQTRGTGRPEYILITTGSSDPHSITKQILEELITRPKVMQWPIRVICGKYNQDYSVIKALEEQYSNIQILQNVPDMWNMMRGAVAAVTAGGTTMNELSCMGVPTVCFSFVDNQEKITTTYAKQGYVHYSGDYLREGSAMIPKLCEALEELVCDAELRKAYSTKVSELVDGLGSQRIAEAVLKM